MRRSRPRKRGSVRKGARRELNGITGGSQALKNNSSHVGYCLLIAEETATGGALTRNGLTAEMRGASLAIRRLR
jgi:hypothetical protein